MIGVEEGIVAALEDADDMCFGTETLSVMQNEAEEPAAKQPCVTENWGGSGADYWRYRRR